MRALFMLLTFAGIGWMIYSSLKSQKQKDEASATRRKKVESVVIEKEKNSPCGDDKP